MDVRPCTDDDLELLRSRWPTGGGVHEAHHARQDTGATTYLVAWNDDEPLGSAVLQRPGCVGANARSAFPDAVEVNHLQVREPFRGLGVGTALIGAAESLAAGLGRAQVAVGVADDNPRARSLYERLGYRPTGVVDTCAYDWVDDEGGRHHAVERSELLVKELPARG